MKKIFSRNLDYIALIATIFLFVIICGYSEAGIKKIPELPNSATIQNNDLLVFENQATNKTNNILFSDLVANFPIPSLADLSDVNLSSPVLDDVLHFNGTEWVNTNISTIAPSNNVYNSDGVLTGNRTLDGDNFNYDLNILNTNNFSVNTFKLNLSSDDHAQLSSNGYVNLSADKNLSLNAGTQAELTAVNEVNLIAPKTTVSKDFYLNDLTPIAQTDILNIDPLSGNVSYVPLSRISPNVQNGLSLSGSDIELGGMLLHNTDIDGDTYTYGLAFNNLSFFNAYATDSYLYTDNDTTIESNGNVSLLSNGNLFGAVAHNTDLRSIPDWDLTSDLSGRIYSGNDVLDLFTVLGANIRGTGFFNKRTSNNVSHYIFAGDATGTGGTSDEIVLGMSDFGLTSFSTEIGIVRDNGLGQGNFRINIYNPTAYYNFDVTNEDNLIENFANTGYTYQRYATSTYSDTSYMSNNHVYGIRFDDAGGEYLQLKNQNIIGPENGYFNLFKTSAVTSVADGILSNGTTLSLTGFNIYTLPNYSNTASEKIVIRDNTTGDLKDSISVSDVEKKMIHSATSGNYSASVNELIIYQGANLGAPFTHTMTLPSASNGDKVIIKLLSSDELQVIPSGTDLIDLASSYVIDGVGAINPSITFEYDSNLNSWIAI